MDNLRKPGLSPATLIDAGVAGGTLVLYDAFPQAYLVLIEPLTEFESDLGRLVRERAGEYLATALGAREGSVTIEVDRNLFTMPPESLNTAKVAVTIAGGKVVYSRP